MFEMCFLDLMVARHPQSDARRALDSVFYFPCPVCEARLPVQLTGTRHRKPYVSCPDCALQMFVRGKKGIQRFKRLVTNSDGKTALEVERSTRTKLTERTGRAKPGRPRKERLPMLVSLSKYLWGGVEDGKR